MRWPIKSKSLKWLAIAMLFCMGAHATVTGRIVRKGFFDSPDRVIEGPVAHGFGFLGVGIAVSWAWRLRKENIKEEALHEDEKA